MTARPSFLPEPFEILELADGQTVELRIVEATRGAMTIRPRYPGAPAEKVIAALRLQLAPGVKTVGPSYFDVTSQTLIAQLIPYLDRLKREQLPFKITAHGLGPRKRFTVEIP